jgi:hypothetical protein
MMSMERRMRGNFHVWCGAGEKLEIISKVYLSLLDGGHPARRMDWRCTSSYIHAFSEAEQVPLRVSWRKNGFFGELYRIGESEPIEWQEPDTQEIWQCPLSKNLRSA